MVFISFPFDTIYGFKNWILVEILTKLKTWIAKTFQMKI